MDDARTDMTKTPNSRHSLLAGSAMTPIERAQRRFMRAPDHDAGTGDAPPAAPADVPADAPADAPAEGGEPSTETLLGGGDQPAADAPADAPGEGEAPPAAGAPDKYELTAPEGFTLDAEALGEAEPVFRDLNLSNDQAQQLMPVAASFAKRIQEAGQRQMLDEVANQRKAWADEAQADKEIGGSNMQASLGSAAKALDRLGFTAGTPFRALLNDSGLGNHPEMIRAWARVGKAIGEDADFTRGEAPPQPKTAERALYGEAFQPKT